MPDSSTKNSGDDASEGGDPETQQQGAQEGASKQEGGNEVESRGGDRDAKDFIIQRKNRKIQDLQDKIGVKEGEEGGQEGELDEEITDQGRKAIKQEIGRNMEPMADLLASQADENELKEVMEEYPHTKPLESKVRKYMKHPDYQRASIKVIALGLAAEERMKQEAKEEADEEAKKSEVGGHARRKTKASNLPNFDKMSDKEVREWEAKELEAGRL